MIGHFTWRFIYITFCVKPGLLSIQRAQGLNGHMRFSFRIVKYQVQNMYIFWFARFSQVLEATTT